jgi:hypothetical protein
VRLIRLTSFLYFWFVTAFAVPLSVSTLPGDEYEASLMLKNGEMDSLDWERVKQFYVQPLNVPAGELRYLKEVVDIAIDGLPVSPEFLQKYAPWGVEDIRRFFQDFPNLVPFKPILSFETGQIAHRCIAGMSVHADETLRPAVLSRFSGFFHPGISLTGSAYHNDSVLEWRTRSVDLRIPGILRLETGNFDALSGGDLFFGYFPDDNDLQTTASNWLYSKSRTWNGVLAATDCWRRLQVSAFYHQRPSENVQDILLQTDAGRFASLGLGLSRAVFTDAPVTTDGDYYLHGCISWHMGEYGASANSGVDVNHPLAVPVSVQVCRKTGGSSVKFLAARVPGVLRLPLSRTAFLCRRYFKGDTAQNGFPDMTLVGCSAVLTGPAGVETGTDLDAVLYENDADVQMTLSVQGNFAVDYRAEYAYRATTSGQRADQGLTVFLRRELSEYIVSALSCRCFTSSRGFESYFLRVPLEIKVASCVTASPFLIMYLNSDGERAAGAGLKHTLHFFEKTWCEWSGQVSGNGCGESVWEGNVRANFLF